VIMTNHDQSWNTNRNRNRAKCRTRYTSHEQAAIVGSILVVAGLILCALLGWL